jgi:hypothetical protein
MDPTLGLGRTAHFRLTCFRDEIRGALLKLWRRYQQQYWGWSWEGYLCMLSLKRDKVRGYIMIRDNSR